MGLTYHVGRILLCLALTFQGLYILGFFPNQPLLNSMKKGIPNFESNVGLSHPFLTQAEKHLPTVVQVIGGLLAIAALNILATSKFIIKLNIVGLLLLTFFIGIPYDVFRGKVGFLDTSYKPLFHFYANMSIIGGLLYYYGSTRTSTTPAKKK